jgi:hypothetical protein
VNRWRGLFAVVFSAALCTGCGASSNGPASLATASPPMSVTGRLDLTALDGSHFNVDLPEGGGQDKPCVGYGGYSDINQGAQVTIRDEKGTVVGAGQLGAGTLDVSSKPPLCQFTWSVKDVPRGHSYYQLEVSHRGALELKEEQLRGVVLSTLG